MGRDERASITPELLAYFAGFFDGEGCAQLTRHNDAIYPRFCVKVSVGQVDPKPLRMLQESFGGKLSMYPNGTSSNARQPFTEWRLVGKKACIFLTAILPNLIVKKEQAELCLSFSRLPWRWKVGWGSTRSPEQAAIDMDYWRKVKLAKRVHSG